MLIDLLAKLLFPRQQRWERRRRVKGLLLGIVLGLITAAVFTSILLYQTSRHSD